MVPTQDLGLYISELTDRGLVINDMHNFKDLRGGQEGDWRYTDTIGMGSRFFSHEFGQSHIYTKRNNP